jgi:hypothetical protein
LQTPDHGNRSRAHQNNRHTMSLARVLTLKGALTGKAIIIRHP